MYVVALFTLVATVDAEAAALAVDLQTLAYDERRKLAALPAVVLLTPDHDRALALDRSLRARGHQPLAVDCNDVVLAARMTVLGDLRFTDDDLVADAASDKRLPWSDISVLVRATDRRSAQTVEQVKEKKFDLTRALASGGLVLNKTVQKTVTNNVDATEPVLYLFRRSGQAPWLLRQSTAHYSALGARVAPTTPANFVATVDELRKRAPHARYDDRLVTRRRPTESVDASDKITSPHQLDLLAHLIAMNAA